LFADQPTCLTDEDLKDIETLSENKSDKSSKEKEKDKKKKSHRSSDSDFSQDLQDSTTWEFERSSFASSPRLSSTDPELDDIQCFPIPERRRKRSKGKSFLQLINLKNYSPLNSQIKEDNSKNERDTMKMSIINSLPDDVETLRKIQEFIASQ
jgi:hypothetical protein